MEYLNADNPENLLSLASTVNALDRNAITVDNSVSLNEQGEPYAKIAIS